MPSRISSQSETVGRMAGLDSVVDGGSSRDPLSVGRARERPPFAGTAVPPPATWTIRRPVRPSKVGSPDGVIVRGRIVVTTLKR